MGVVSQLLAQVLDVNFEVVSGLHVFLAPDPFQENAVGHDPPRVPGQVVEKVILSGGQSNQAAPDATPPPQEIDMKVSADEGLLVGAQGKGLGSPQDRLKA